MTEQDVRELHQPWGLLLPICREDAQPFPCRTIQAIDRRENPDMASIVPRYLLIQIEADKLYPQDGPDPDLNLALRSAFKAGADWADANPPVPG